MSVRELLGSLKSLQTPGSIHSHCFELFRTGHHQISLKDYLLITQFCRNLEKSVEGKAFKGVTNRSVLWRCIKEVGDAFGNVRRNVLLLLTHNLPHLPQFVGLYRHSTLVEGFSLACLLVIHIVFGEHWMTELSHIFRFVQSRLVKVPLEQNIVYREHIRKSLMQTFLCVICWFECATASKKKEEKKVFQYILPQKSLNKKKMTR